MSKPVLSPEQAFRQNLIQELQIKANGGDPFWEYNGRGAPPEVRRQAQQDLLRLYSDEKADQERAAQFAHRQLEDERDLSIEQERIRLEDERIQLEADRVQIEKAKVVVDAIVKIGSNPELREQFAPLLEQMALTLALTDHRHGSSSTKVQAQAQPSQPQVLQLVADCSRGSKG